MKGGEISKLVPQMQIVAELFIQKCKELEVEVLIYDTTRTLEEQSILYRKGRSHLQIKNKCRLYRSRGFGYLADILESTESQRGSQIITHSGPGESLNNLAEAFSAVPIIDNNPPLHALHNTSKYIKEWGVMYSIADEIKLNYDYCTALNNFRLRKNPNPTRIYSPEKLKEILINGGLLQE